MHGGVYWNRPVLQIKPRWAVVFSPSAAPIRAVRNKDLDEALSPSFSYISGKLKVYNNLGWGLQHGGFPVVSGVFIGLDLFPDFQIRTTH